MNKEQRVAELKENVSMLVDQFNVGVKELEDVIIKIVGLKDNEKLTMNMDLFNVRYNNFYFNVLDSKSSEVFGCGFDLRYSKSFGDDEYSLYMNFGTSGSFTKEDVLYIQKIQLMANVSSKLEKIEEVLNDFMIKNKNLISLFKLADYEINKLNAEIEDEAAEIREEKLLGLLKQNNNIITSKEEVIYVHNRKGVMLALLEGSRLQVVKRLPLGDWRIELLDKVYNNNHIIEHHELLDFIERTLVEK